MKNLRGTAISPETVEVSWEAPASSGPEPTQYKLFYIRKDHETNEEETETVVCFNHYFALFRRFKY